MKFDFFARRSRLRSRRGFSLVVSLVMMALMLMVAIALVSFVYVQARLTESKLKRSQAQINAICGMRMALGQLQLLTGDDQRVTATGDIFGGVGNESLPEGKALNGKRFWTGVWATGGLDKSKIRDWSVYSPDKKPFLGWLVSDYDSSKEVFSPNENPINAETATRVDKSLLKVIQDEFKYDDEKLDLITLVGKGSLGGNRDAADELSYNEREVKVRRVPITRYSAATDEAIRPTSGSFAYWVGDEGVKAKVNIADGTNEKFLNKQDWEQQFNVVAQRNGVALVEGLERFDSWWDKDVQEANSAASTRLPQVQSPSGLAVYAEGLGGTGSAELVENMRELYHDVSFVSQGVFSDTYNGGLKTDLSLAFEMPWFSEGSWKKGFRDIKQFHGSGEKNNLNLLSRFGSGGIPSDEKWWTDYNSIEGGLGYLYEIATGETTRNRMSEVEYLRGPTWDLVRNYYRLYKREDEAKGFRGLKPKKKDSWIAVGSKPYSYLSGHNDQAHGINSGGYFGQKFNYSRVACRHTLSYWGNASALLTEFSGRTHPVPNGGDGTCHLIIPQSMRIAPVIRRFVFRCSIVMSKDTAALCLDPIMTIHNPYNVPIEFYGLGAYWTKFYPFQLRLTRLDADENGKVRNWPGADTSVITYSFHDIMGMNAGDTALVSRIFAGTNDVNKASSGTIRMEPGEVKVVFPYSSSMTNKGLINDRMVISLGDFEYEEKSVAAIMLPRINLSQLDPEKETLVFKVDVEPFDGSGGTHASSYCDLDIFAFNLYYPKGSEGQNLESVAGVQRIWRRYIDVADLSDENLIQVISSRRYFPQDVSIDIGTQDFMQDTSTTGVLNAEKNYFAYVDIKNLPASGENGSPLVGPFSTNARPWAVDPRSWDANLKERHVGVGWAKTVEKDMMMNPIEYRNGKGYWGDGVGAADGQTNIVLFEIPTAPLTSLGQLQHVECSVLEMEPSYVVANSYPSIGFKDDELDSVLVWPETGYMRDGVHERLSTTQSPQPRGDTPFAANLNLFDRYFFSGINFGDAHSAQSKDIESFITNVFSTDEKNSPFPNKRVTFIRDFGDRKESDVKEDFYDPEKVARNLLYNGSFNINSTSVEAWKAVLSGLHEKIMKIDGAFKKLSDIPIVRFAALIGRGAGGLGTVADNFGNEGGGWRWYAELQENDLQKLAESIVEQVRLRGPFMSLGDFVNRRLTTGETGKAGALQAAIDDSKINKSRAGGFNDSGSTKYDQTRYPNLFPTDDKLKKRGIPGYVSQGDILANVGAGFSARSDTFTIRAYGDISGITGMPQARAWCEAVVQRMPEFFDPQYDEEVDEEVLDTITFLDDYRSQQAEGLPPQHVLEKWERNKKLSSVNKLFGRRYKIISFRWLSQDEI